MDLADWRLGSLFAPIISGLRDSGPRTPGDDSLPRSPLFPTPDFASESPKFPAGVEVFAGGQKIKGWTSADLIFSFLSS